MTSRPRVPSLEPELANRRRLLIASLRGVVRDRRVVDAMAKVRRDLFVPVESRDLAYEDRAIAIGSGQTISQPQIVGVMTEALRLRPTDMVLDVGTGSGYQAAILSLLVSRVVSVERLAALAESAATRLGRLGYGNVDVHVAGDDPGWPAGAPYDAIVVAAAAPALPPTLAGQLAPGGRLVVPVGSLDHQTLVVASKSATGSLALEELGLCQFVPLIGAEGWPE